MAEDFRAMADSQPGEAIPTTAAGRAGPFSMAAQVDRAAHQTSAEAAAPGIACLEATAAVLVLHHRYYIFTAITTIFHNILKEYFI